MRHVILGSDTTLGSSILRVLVSIGNQEIVCCNPDGIIPTDVPTTSITTFNVDIRNLKMLEAILQEGDIIYNAQVYDDENIISKDFNEVHVSGMKNLLEIGNSKKVKKIVSYLPQKITWDVPDEATEETDLNPLTNYQKSLYETLETANKYFDKSLFHVEVDDQEGSTETESVIKTSESENEDDNLTNTIEDETEILESEDSDEEEEENADANIDTSIKPPSLLASPPSLQASPPSLQASPPSLDPPSLGPTEEKLDVLEVNKSHDKNESDSVKEENTIEESAEIDLIETNSIQDENKYNVPLVIGRISRFYGPFDYTITKKVCQSVRLQRMKIVGKLRKKISWINPLDAGRAMIIMGDDKVSQGQYNITGFVATGSELIDTMEQINHSKTKIRRKLFLTSSLNAKIKLLISKIGFIKRIDLDEIYGLNRTQVYSDIKAQNEWNWKPKYDITITSKDSLNWFVNHVL